MPLSEHCFVDHQERWQGLLRQSRAPTRHFWPKYLFRHEQIENAAAILRSGELLSRRMAAVVGFQDVAATDVICLNDRAKDFVRMYFRPKTPTQYRIEGIRKPGEIFQGAHAPVLVMFVLLAQRILLNNGTKFSDGNMQTDRTRVGDSDDFFNAIDFERVYHSFSISSNDSSKAEIIRSRCAEVLATSPLPLEGNLVAILCRSPAERNYLQHLLGDVAGRWAGRIFVHTEPAIFEKRWAFVESVDAASDGVYFRFHPRGDALPCDFSVEVTRQGVRIGGGTRHAADLSLRWRVPGQLGPGNYSVRIDLDGSTAYVANHLLDDLPY